MPDRVQTICSIYLPLCKSLLPPFPSIRPQVLVLSVRGPAILCCSGCSAQVRCLSSAFRRGFYDSERSSVSTLVVMAFQEVCP